VSNILTVLQTCVHVLVRTHLLPVGRLVFVIQERYMKWSNDNIFILLTIIIFSISDCGALTASNFLHVRTVTGGNTTFNESTTAHCMPGFRVIGSNDNSANTAHLTCEASGNWTAFIGCEKKVILFCYIIDMLNNQTISCVHAYKRFTWVVYQSNIQSEFLPICLPSCLSVCVNMVFEKSSFTTTKLILKYVVKTIHSITGASKYY